VSETSNDKHEQALDLTEQALEALDKGDEKQADQLIEKAKSLDPSAPAEIVQDLEEG
jgi:phage shock protein A